MARNLNMAFFIAMAAAALVMNSAGAATTYQVGDGLGWTIPTASPYTTWASNKSFIVGDILVFTFSSGVHDVAEVTKAAYDACSATSPISLQTSPPANVTLNSSGEHYFICTFGGHCTAGQKLAINVTGASSPAPTPSTSTSPPSPSPSPPAAVPAPAPSTTATPPSPSSPSPAPPAAVPAPAPSTTATPPSSTATPPSPSSGATPPSPSTPSSPPPGGAASPPPPPGSAATSVRVAGLSATLLSIALALLF